jgi:hypothetical protein
VTQLADASVESNATLNENASDKTERKNPTRLATWVGFFLLEDLFIFLPRFYACASVHETRPATSIADAEIFVTRNVNTSGPSG